MVTVIEGGRADGTDLVMPAEPRYEQRSYVLPVSLDGIEAKIGIRVVIAGGRLKFVRTLCLQDVNGFDVPRAGLGEYIDDVERAIG